MKKKKHVKKNNRIISQRFSVFKCIGARLLLIPFIMYNSQCLCIHIPFSLNWPSSIARHWSISPYLMTLPHWKLVSFLNLLDKETLGVRNPNDHYNTLNRFHKWFLNSFLTRKENTRENENGDYFDTIVKHSPSFIQSNLWILPWYFMSLIGYAFVPFARRIEEIK